MRMSDKEVAIAFQEWKHWYKYWYIYLVVFGFAALTFSIMADSAIFETTVIGIIAGVSAFLRQLSDIYGRTIYSFFATLGVMVPIILIAPKEEINSGSIWALFLLASIVGTTIALLYGVIGRYIHPNKRL